MAAVVMKVQQVEEFASKKVFGGDTDHGSSCDEGATGRGISC